ncbi:MAG: hypothetical protein IJS84_08970 [Spirochaetales bacterium]|nr:hypothetical protein [Spirochaetales bacterium]
MEKKIKAMKAASVCLYILTFILMVVAACCFALSNKIYFLFAALALASLVCGFIITDKRQNLEPAREAAAQAEAKVSKKPKALIVMCVAFVLVFLFGFIAKCFETSGFSVKVSDFTLTKEMTLSYNGGEINGKSFAMKNDTSYSVTMYVPSTATEANPAPTVFVLPGFTRTKATMAQYCIELSKRGAVVFCLDPGGQGGTTETSTTGANGIEFLVQYVYNNTDDFKFVDRSRFGAVGHSAGGGNVCTLAADMAFGSYEESIIKAVYISGYIKVSSANKYANLRSNAALSYAYYDEGAFRYQTDTSSFEVITRRFINEVNNSKNSYDDVIYDYGYGDMANGTYRIIHRENINHCFEMYDRISIANTIDFFNETLAMGSPLKGTCQTWLGKEICNGLALAAAFTFVISLCAFLVKLPFFASMKEAQQKVMAQPDPNARKSVAHKVIFWFSMIVTAVIACLDYIPLANLSINIFPTGNSSSVYTFVFPARMINAILLWAVINGAIGLVIFFGTTIVEYFIEKARAKTKDVEMEEFDWGKFKTVKICSGKSNALVNTLKALLMSLIMFCSFYLLVFVSYKLLHQDFRFMLVSAAPINARMFVTAIEYIPLIFVFYISNSIRVNGSIAREGWKEWKVLLVGALANSIGLAFILLINYVCYFTQGAPFYGYWGNGTEIWLYVNMVFALVVMMFILPIFNRLLYRITGNVWTGALGWCMIFIMMTISASVSYIPMY